MIYFIYIVWKGTIESIIEAALRNIHMEEKTPIEIYMAHSNSAYVHGRYLEEVLSIIESKRS